MTPERAIEQARQGKLLPVYVVVGEERLFRDEVLGELRAAARVESSCLVVVGSKLDGRRKFALMARKQDFLVACEPLEARALAPWIIARCASKGHAIDRDVADLIAAVAGPQLSPVDDAIERLSL